MPTPYPGGCIVVEDPYLDALQANPLWARDTDDLLRVRAAGPRATSTSQPFGLWQTPGRKHIAHRGSDLLLTVRAGVQWLRVVFEAALVEGSPFQCTVPLGPGLRHQLAQFQGQARLLEGEPDLPCARGITRASLLHLRALQALDGAQGGASHRDIAGVLFGADAVRERWTADSELRAQVRHLLARGEGLMRGGYLALAGVRQPHPETSGDEPGA